MFSEKMLPIYARLLGAAPKMAGAGGVCTSVIGWNSTMYTFFGGLWVRL